MATKRTRTAKRSTPRKQYGRRGVAGKPWSREEIAFIRKYYRNNETSWVARQLGRSVYSVRYKACDLNIKKANPSVWKGNSGVTKTKKSARRRPVTSRKAVSRRQVTKRRWASSRRRVARPSTRRRSYRRH
ncbi:MAG: hypothetical protein RBT76_08310 [candidate division Zixibacteria bacterium]|jgi:hypothetical protein|nr:hypothetical protein [candidate division Zixibacteria bacterium]